ncbi:MAG: hypothetical protein JNN17_12175 [Verrucomicrobiaceae bacterium]|nr:hypothetical protein [Verrucomicrobiaceae bacterium]
MKANLLKLLGASLCAVSLSSCYVYDDPLTWSGNCRGPVYGRGYYSPPVYRSYGYSRSCAPVPPPPCGPSFRPHHGHFRHF